MNKLEYTEKILKKLLWIYDDKHRFYLDNGYRFEGRTEAQWLALVLEHAKKAMGLLGGIEPTVLPYESENSTKAKFLDPVTKKVITLPFDHYMSGTDYPLNGIRLLELNIPDELFQIIEMKSGLILQTLNDEKSVNLISKFQNAITRLENYRDMEKGLKILHYLLTMAQLRPDSIFNLEEKNL